MRPLLLVFIALLALFFGLASATKTNCPAHEKEKLEKGKRKVDKIHRAGRFGKAPHY